MMTRIQTASVALTGLLVGAALSAALLGSPTRVAHGEPSDLITRSDVVSIVRSLEAQARATQDLAREVHDAGKQCGR